MRMRKRIVQQPEARITTRLVAPERAFARAKHLCSRLVGMAGSAAESGFTGGTIGSEGADSDDDSGCGCRMASSGHRNEFGLSLLLGAIVLDWTRRRRRLDAPQR